MTKLRTPRRSVVRIALLAGALASCRGGTESETMEALPGAGAEPPEIAAAPSSDEDSTACEASRIWKYAALSYQAPLAAADALRGDPSFPGAVIIARFAAQGTADEVVPTYLVRDASSCNLLISVRGTVNGDDAATYVAGTKNFYVITRYNWSAYYAMSVLELGEEVKAAMRAD